MKKKVLTEKEVLEQERMQELSNIQMVIPFLNEPTYIFVVGAQVHYGNIQKSVIQEILYEGKAYGLLCTHIQNGKTETHYRIVPWMSIRPTNQGTTRFSKNEDLRLNYENSSVESLVHTYYYFGIDTNPEYQREYVWNQEDQELLIDSIFNRINIGSFVLAQNSYEKVEDPLYEIIDGKQRLLTLIAFYENRISYQGVFYNDLSGFDRATFLHCPVSLAKVRECDLYTKLRYFLMVNRAGKVMAPEHLQSIEEKMAKLQEVYSF